MSKKQNVQKMDALKYMRNNPLLNRKRIDPGSFDYTGKTHAQPIDIQLFTYNKESCQEQRMIQPGQVEKLEFRGALQWLNIHGLHDTSAIATICTKQGIHNLVIQDVLDINQRPKFQEFENFSFLTLKSIVPSDTEMITEQISIVFGEKFLISFQERKADFFDHLRHRLREDIGIVRERGSDYLLYAMLESILDNYFKTLNKLDEEIGALSFAGSRSDPTPNVLEIIESRKKFVHFIRKSILPIKEFTLIAERGECRNIEQRHVKYYLEIKDLCLTLLDSCDMILSSLESSTNLFFSMQGHRMNQVMKTLTIVATIFIPLTFIAGIYGMNFSNMPELEWTYGYLGTWVLFILVFLGMVWYFRKKKWF